MAVAVLAIVLLASARGYLVFVNGAIYDWVSTLPARSVEVETSPVILIDMDPSVFHSSPDIWRNLLQRITAMEPRQIVLLEHPRRLTPQAYEDISKQVDLVGIHETARQTDGASIAFTDHALTKGIFSDKALIAIMPVSERGVYRRLPLVRLKSREPDQKTLIATAILNHQGTAFDANDIYPNFLSSSNAPPRIHAGRFIAGEIPADLVRSKTVLIAAQRSASTPALFTPGGRSGEVDAAGFQARALHSVLTNRYILPFPFANLIASLIVLAIGCLYFYQRVNLTISIYFSIAMVVVCLSLSIGLLHYLYVMFPVTESLLVVLGMWVTVLNRKYVAEQQGMLLELNNISKLMQKRLVPDDLLHDERYWQKIGRMVQQLLQFDRSIFLETLPGQRRLQEIHSINCDLFVIDERRRDYERAPYTTALQARAPIPVSNYLNEASENESQYLVPLHVEAEVLGFWAFAFSSESADREDTLRVAGHLAGEIAALLQQRKQVQAREQRGRRRWVDYMALQGGRSLAKDLKDALNVTTKRLEVVEELFAASESAILLYDSFGQLLLENPAAARLCASCGIDAYAQSYNDTLGNLAGLGPGISQAYLQRVLFTGAHVSLPLNTKVADVVGMISVSALGSASANPVSASSGQSLQKSGVVFEIHLGSQTTKSAIPEWMPQILSLQNEQPQLQLWRSAHEYLGALGHNVQQDALPLLKSTLDDVVRAAAKQIRTKRLKLDISLETEVQVMVPAVVLLEVLGALFKFAVEDAKLGSEITVTLSSSWPVLEVQIHTDGIGIPVASIPSRNSSAQLVVPAISPMEQAITSVERFHGHVKIESNVGVGCVVTLCLPALPMPGEH
jgi:hypothetical protein